jgi:retinol dehydrogenase 12
MNKKIVIITGATSGIGKETAIALARQGAHLVLPVRNIEKGETLKKEISRVAGDAQVDLFPCDLTSFKSIQDFAGQFLETYDRLDVLINNAGIWETRRNVSKDGIEMNLAVNHLAPFLLTNLLLDLLKESSPARIINVSSAAHKQGKIQFNDIEMQRGWGSLASYAQSKLANILFTRKLARILEGTGVTVNCLHPGVVNTRLFDKMPGFLLGLFKLFMITPEKGARTSIFLASSQDVASVTGEYFSNSRIARTTKLAKSNEAADKLWEISLGYVDKILSARV